MPPRAGAAGADKFACELFPRLVKLGCKVTVFGRLYPGDEDHPAETVYKGVQVVWLPTVARKGFDTLLHSGRATWHILRSGDYDVVHIQNGGNSPFAGLLRLLGLRTYVSQDGLDWQREKWPWYARLYLWLTQYVSSWAPTSIIFDNVFAKEYFEKKFSKQFHFVPFGADVEPGGGGDEVLGRLGLEPQKYVLFVGRFIPDKGLHYLVPAFEGIARTDRKLVLVGGSPNPSDYETQIRSTTDERIVFPGFIYGKEMHALMRHACLYVQPSDVEGLSPVILESAYLGVPIVCSDIPQNVYILGEHAAYFRAGDTADLRTRLETALEEPEAMAEMARQAQQHVHRTYSWDTVARDHLRIFNQAAVPDKTPSGRQIADTVP